MEIHLINVRTFHTIPLIRYFLILLCKEQKCQRPPTLDVISVSSSLFGSGAAPVLEKTTAVESILRYKGFTADGSGQGIIFLWHNVEEIVG